MNQIKIGEFLKNFVKRKDLLKNSLQNNLIYCEGLYQDGKPGVPKLKDTTLKPTLTLLP